MPKSTIAYKDEENSFQKFLSWTNEKEALGEEINKYIDDSYKSLLDVGAGNGDLTKHYINHFKNVMLVEPAKPLCKELKKKFPDAILISKSIEDIHKFDKKYDFIVASHVFIYVHEPEKIIELLLKTLNKNGTLLIIMLEKTGDYLKFIDRFQNKVNKGVNKQDEYRWEDIVGYLVRKDVKYELKDVITTINPPSLEDFLGINDFNFNTDVSNLSNSLLDEMREYLKKYEKAGGFEVGVKHKFIVVKSY